MNVEQFYGNTRTKAEEAADVRKYWDLEKEKGKLKAEYREKSKDCGDENKACTDAAEQNMRREYDNFQSQQNEIAARVSDEAVRADNAHDLAVAVSDFQSLSEATAAVIADLTP